MNLKNKTLPDRVGGLLYTPAINVGIADKIEQKVYHCLTSMAFCLEDSIQDDALEHAEQELKKTLTAIKCKNISEEDLPLLFVRIRNPQHLIHVNDFLGDTTDILTGYILPKFDLTNGADYINNILLINKNRKKPLYIMPILESKMIADIEGRTHTLLNIKSYLAKANDYVLNVRVGGNDFSNLYGLRRSVTQNVYQIGVIRDILIDIINVFAADYVVSGPVWEYFGAENGTWSDGLCKELELDRLNGFIGKTAIHPSQIPHIYESMKVLKADYEDALKILNWNPSEYGVEKSADGSRMNEVKCHTKWATRIAILGEIYGVREEL